MKGMWDALLELLFPSRCVFCHRLTGGPPVCPDCPPKKLLVSDGERERKIPDVDRWVAPLYYEGPVRDSLHRYKFGGLRFYRKIYGEILSKCVDGGQFSCDIITWAPLSRKRLRRRGYDQARLLAEELSARLGVPCAPLLKKCRDNPPQSGAGGPEARRANVAGVYAAVDGAKLKGRRVLLVDDIITTGATLSACAGALRAAGAEAVCACAVARTRK